MSAILSPCLSYRYRLERELGMFGPVGAFLMVNPSTADAELDDHTIRKVRGFASRLGWSRVIVGNVFAYRATDVSELALVPDPIGPENSQHLSRMLMEADRVICAWGALQKLPERLRGQWRSVAQVAKELEKPLECLGTVKDGHPKHPLMVSYSVQVELWSPPDVAGNS